MVYIVPTRHDFIQKRLRELGMYDKSSDYGGKLGEWVETLSSVLEDRTLSQRSTTETLRLLSQLIDEWGGLVLGVADKGQPATPNV